MFEVAGTVRLDNGIEKSQNDHREYRVIELQNGLRAILISDKINIHGKQPTAKSDSHHHADLLLHSLSVNDADSTSSESEEDNPILISRVKSHPSLSALNQSPKHRMRTCSASENVPDAGNSNHSAGRSVQFSNHLKLFGNFNKPQHSKLAAAALCVGVGSFSDPKETEGLAHFLEHVLFMGCKKYPDENGFDVFLKLNGGSNNASTDAERTVFEFDISQEKLHDGLDRFANCFVNPLFLKSSIENELKAVDSEFVQSVQSDGARRLQLLSSIAKSNHPFSKFLWGNSISLKEKPEENNIDMQEMLKSFYKKFYHAENMTLAVCSSESLDALQSMVEECFDVLPCRSIQSPDFSQCQEPFDMDIFHRIYYVVPVRDIHHLEITWVLPSVMRHYRVKAMDYISWLVGHEGKGSVQALLKERGLVLSIVAGNGEAGVEHNTSYSFFTCSASLTDKGAESVNEVITVIFQYIKMLQDHGPLREVYEEIQALERMKFNFEEQEEPVDYVQNLCENLQVYDIDDVLTGQVLLQDYDEGFLRCIQDALTPENANFVIMWKKYASICTEEEKWFKTKYVSKQIPKEWAENWKNLERNDQLHLPKRNPFIAKDFSLVIADREASQFPVLIHESARGKLWYKHDTTFQLPKARLYFHLITPLPYNSIKNAVCADLFLSIFNYQLKEVAYDAAVAELSYDISMGEKGMTMCFDGFNDKLKLLVDVVLELLCNFQFTTQIFQIIKEVALRSYKNYLLKPAKLVRTIRLCVLQSVHWTSNEKRLACLSLTEGDVREFAIQLKSSMKIHGLAQGNISSKDALDYQNEFYKLLQYRPLAEDEFPTVIVNRLPIGSSVIRHNGFNQNDANTVLTNYYQVGPGDVYEFALTQLLVHMMEEPCFDILRTKWQLGYTVYASCRSTFGIIGMSVTVESEANKFTANRIDERIDEFLTTFHTILVELTNENFQQQLNALMLLKQHVDLSLADESDRNFSEIYNETYLFCRLDREVEALRSITKQDLIKWFQQFRSNSLKYRKLSVQVVGSSLASTKEVDNESDSESGSGSSEEDNDDTASDDNNDDDTDFVNLNDTLTISPLDVNDSTYTHYINDINVFKAKLIEYPVSKIN